MNLIPLLTHQIFPTYTAWLMRQMESIAQEARSKCTCLFFGIMHWSPSVSLQASLLPCWLHYSWTRQRMKYKKCLYCIIMCSTGMPHPRNMDTVSCNNHKIKEFYQLVYCNILAISKVRALHICFTTWKTPWFGTYNNMSSV